MTVGISKFSVLKTELSVKFHLLYKTVIVERVPVRDDCRHCITHLQNLNLIRAFILQRHDGAITLQRFLSLAKIETFLRPYCGQTPLLLGRGEWGRKLACLCRHRGSNLWQAREVTTEPAGQLKTQTRNKHKRSLSETRN